MEESHGTYQEPTFLRIITDVLVGILYAPVISLPLLFLILVLAAFRRGLKKDREQFEAKVLALLEEIGQALLTSREKT